MLEIGTQAPEFTLPDQNGEAHSLADYRGQKVILYFYPKAAPSRRARSASCIRSFARRARWCWA